MARASATGGQQSVGASSEAGWDVIGLDTSVLVRLLIGLPEAQARTARRRLEQAVEAGEPVLVSDLVLAEAYYALQHHYAVPRGEAQAILRRFIESGIVQLQPPASASALIGAGGAGLVDRLIHLRYRSLGAITLTFERRQGNLEGAVRLPRG
jgi:predicted nucleic-acid-binding protein